MESSALLATDELSRDFGALRALDRVALSVQAGERHAVIGPNGAGKTTLFNLISGELQPTTGRVYFDGADITGRPPEECARRGIGRTFQQTTMFPALTPFESVILAVQRQTGAPRSFRTQRSVETRVVEESRRILTDVGLTEVAEVPNRNLSYGYQRQLELALALAIAPKLLLLDEPTAGLASDETNAMVQLINALPQSLTVVIIEHDMDVIFTVADRITVLDHGRIIAAGTPTTIGDNPDVRNVYLGLHSDVRKRTL